MPFTVKINVALREQNCQKIGSERVKEFYYLIKELFNWIKDLFNWTRELFNSINLKELSIYV